MANRLIEVDTNLLRRDIQLLEQKLQHLAGGNTKLFDAVAVLNAMWEGPAKQAFDQQVLIDQEMLAEMQKQIGGMIEEMRAANTEYCRCEDDVEAIIRAIKV